MSSYNQSAKAQSVRVGNWFEEIRLRDDTGVRYYPNPTDRSNSLLTKSRCIEHSDRVHPKDYTTVSKSTLPDPRTYKVDRKYDVVGPRTKLREESFKKAIDEELERKATNDFNESRRLTYLTASKESFTKANFTPTLRENDSSIRMPTKNANYTSDNAITIYSHAVQDPKQKIFFPVSFVGSTNPFRRNNFYSADVRSTQLNIRTETDERPNPLPTVEQFKVLSLLVANLIEVARKELMRLNGGSDSKTGPVPGEAIRYIIVALYSSENTDVMPLREFESFVLGTYFGGFELRESERKALLAAFDARSEGRIVVSDFIKFIKRTPSPRRLELLEFFFNASNPDSQKNVSTENLQKRMDAARLPPYHLARYFLNYLTQTYPDIANFQEYNISDFFDYFVEVSNEIENDDKFEEFLKDTWGFLTE